MNQALKEHQEKVQLGLVPKSERLNPIEKAEQNPNSLKNAIRAKCYDCSGYIRKDVTDCDMPDCELYNVRPWQKPSLKKPVNGSDTPLSEKSVIKKYDCSDKVFLPERHNPDGNLLSPYTKLKDNPKSRRVALNAYCFWCSCEQYKEVKLCTAGHCPLHHLRPWQHKD